MTTVFIISAPSGSGKSTLVNNVRKLIPDLEFSVSYTTRKPRGNEQNGREYFFISRPEFEARIAKNEFLEYAAVFGNYYGTARRFLEQAEEQGRDLLLDIDVQGAAQIKSKVPDAVSIFILPPNRQQLEQRLRDRGLDSEEVIHRRLLNASREIENYRKYDYILVNDRLDESTENLKSILMAERLKRSGQHVDDSVRRRAESCRLDNVRERLRPILASFASARSWRLMVVSFFQKLRRWLSSATRINKRGERSRSGS
jgi:guanylate kinase